MTIITIIATNNIIAHLICALYAIDCGGWYITYMYVFLFIIYGGKTIIIIIIIRRVPLCVRHRKAGRPRGV